MRCNTSAAINSLIADEPNDFLDYLASSGQPAKAESIVPRDLVGEYVRTRYRQYAERAASRGIHVTHHAARATAIRIVDHGRCEVLLDDGPSQEFDRVVVSIGFNSYKVAAGFAPYQHHPRLLASPFPVPQLRQRLTRPNSRVLVLGTGQSAVDAAIALCHDGHQVTMASRTGLLPAVRDRLVPAPATIPSLTEITALDPDDPLLGLKIARIVVRAIRTVSHIPLREQLSFADDATLRLREEVELLETGRSSWQTIIFPLVDQVIAWTVGLPPAKQRDLLTAYRHVTWRYASSMVAENARALIRHIDAGQLEVSSYNPARVIARDAGFDVDLHRRGQQSFDYVVTAVGFNPPVLHIDDRTVYLTDPPPAATALDHLDNDLRVRLDRCARPENIWLVGQTTHIHTFWAHILALNSIQAHKVARQLSASTDSTIPQESKRSAGQAPDTIIMPATWNSYR